MQTGLYWRNYKGSNIFSVIHATATIRDCFNNRERMNWLCRHDTDPIASLIIPRPPSPGPRTALIKTGNVRKTSIIRWTILIPSKRISPRSSRLFLPGITHIPIPMAMRCPTIRIRLPPSSPPRRRRNPGPSPDSTLDIPGFRIRLNQHPAL